MQQRQQIFQLYTPHRIHRTLPRAFRTQAIGRGIFIRCYRRLNKGCANLFGHATQRGIIGHERTPLPFSYTFSAIQITLTPTGNSMRYNNSASNQPTPCKMPFTGSGIGSIST